jgi:uncharacterized membrane protein YfcA
MLKREHQNRIKIGYEYKTNDFKITPDIAGQLVKNSIIAGTLASMVGIGGGLVIVPLLLTIEVPTLVTSATGGFTVLFSSFLSLT